MTNHGRSNICRHTFHRILAVAVLALASGTPAGAVFAQSATSAASMKIGIIGSGNIAARWERFG